jgi:hypothetical protein
VRGTFDFFWLIPILLGLVPLNRKNIQLYKTHFLPIKTNKAVTLFLCLWPFLGGIVLLVMRGFVLYNFKKELTK